MKTDSGLDIEQSAHLICEFEKVVKDFVEKHEIDEKTANEIVRGCKMEIAGDLLGWQNLSAVVLKRELARQKIRTREVDRKVTRGVIRDAVGDARYWMCDIMNFPNDSDGAGAGEGTDDELVDYFSDQYLS